MTLSPSRQVAISRQLCCVEDIDLIQDIVLDFQPWLTVIIGAGSGTMSLGWLEVSSPERMLVSVDISADNLEWERKAWQAGGWGLLPANTGQIIGDSSAVGMQWEQLWKGIPVEFLVVDGDHSEEGVRKDLQAWLPHMAEHSIIMLHDYEATNAPEQYPGVKVAADELLLDWHFEGKRGWSAWWKR